MQANDRDDDLKKVWIDSIYVLWIDIDDISWHFAKTGQWYFLRDVIRRILYIPPSDK